MDAHSRFIAGGLRFFAFAWIAALLLLLAAPVAIVGVLCLIALAGASAGLLLHLLALRASDHDAYVALRAQPAAIARQARELGREAWIAACGIVEAVRFATGLARTGDGPEGFGLRPTPLSAGTAFQPPV
jgi:hypothetical protein